MITGIAGFIGSNLAERCLSEGWTVDGVDDLSNGHVEFLPKGVQWFLAGSFDSNELSRRFDRESYDCVVHLAAIPRVSYSVEHLIETNENNVTRTLNLIERCKGNVGKFVFASSSSVYGDTKTLPTKEDDVLSPKSPYALQKWIVERYLEQYYAHYGFESVSLRFFNVFGKNALGSSPYATALASWLSSIVEGRPMRCDGDGSQTRDLCHVDNVCEAIVRILKNDKRLTCEKYNVACGTSTSNSSILRELSNRFPSAQIVNAPWRVGDVMHTLADISKIKRDFGYEPIVDVWNGVEKTIEWATTSPLFKTLKSSI